MMEKITHGITRTVFLTKRYAFKLPCCRYGWKMFLQGLLANMQERVWGRSGYDGICPVIWADRFGFLVVQPRVEVLDMAMSEDEYIMFCYRQDYIIPAENKSDSFGYLNGKLVAIDYGN